MIPVEMLEGLCFLRGIGEDYLRQIASITVMKEIVAGTAVFREGDHEGHIYIVTDGRVALEIKGPAGPVRILTVGPGELLGWSPLLGNGRTTATARALTSCKLLALSAPQALALSEHNPRLGMELFRRTAFALAQRLSATRLQLLDVYREELPVVPEVGGEA